MSRDSYYETKSCCNPQAAKTKYCFNASAPYCITCGRWQSAPTAIGRLPWHDSSCDAWDCKHTKEYCSCGHHRSFHGLGFELQEFHLKEKLEQDFLMKRFFLGPHNCDKCHCMKFKTD